MIRSKLVPCLVAAITVLVGGLSSARSDDPPSDRDRQIENLEKTLAEVRAQLDKLKTDKPQAVAADKKPLSFAEADSWRSIRSAVLSPDGKWFAQRVGPAEGDGEVILRDVAGDKETKFPAGSGFGQLQFAADSKWLAFTVNPYVKPGSPAPTAANPRPKPKVFLIGLVNAAKSEFEGIGSFQFSGDSATHLALRKASGPSTTGSTTGATAMARRSPS